MTELVSIIVPTFNRYNLLLETINSISRQTYKNFELIIIDDCSTDERYITLEDKIKSKFPNLNFKLIRNQYNSLKIIGFPCAAYNRNKGLEIAKGEYISFCDDDDIWLPYKLSIQIDLMKRYNLEMSSTEGFDFNRPLTQYEKDTFDLSKFQLFLSQKHYSYLSKILNIQQFPLIWDKKFLLIHNCMINSSVTISRKLFNQVGMQPELKNGQEDYTYWLKCLEFTNSVYVHMPCIGYTGYNTKFY